MSQNMYNLGRIIYSIPLSITGLIYLLKPQNSVETLTSFIPGELNLIYLAGAMWLVLGLLLAFGYKTQAVCYSVIGLISAYLIMVHVPAVYTGEYLYVVWFELLRDLSLMGGAFMILAMVPKEEDIKEEWSRTVF
jgi:uncharacterized membrane protein YphA (DoxX/SURF4 family)